MAHGEPSDRETEGCGYHWRDGWSHEVFDNEGRRGPDGHVCVKLVTKEGHAYHLCKCDVMSPNTEWFNNR